MSKKSYKQMQNRLYREIKQRIKAEEETRFIRRIVSTKPVIQRQKIDCLRIRQSIPRFMISNGVDYKEVVEYNLVAPIVKKMCEDGYINLSVEEKDYGFETMCEIEATVYITKPPKEID